MRVRRLLPVAGLATCLVLAPPAWAAWSDPAPVQGVTVAAHAAQPPDSVACAAATPNATVSWTEKDPRYDYQVRLRRVDGSWTGGWVAVTGAATSHTFTAPGDFNISLVAVGNHDFKADVRSHPVGVTGWTSGTRATAKTIRVTVLLLNVLGSVSCV